MCSSDLLLKLNLLPRLDGGVTGNPAAQGHEHEHNGVFRHRDGVTALVVAHKDALFPGGGGVDGVEGHPLGVNQPQLGE